MNIVNKYFLDDIVSPLAGGVDFDEFQYLHSLDSNGDIQMKAVIREHLLPYFEDSTPDYKAKFRVSLAYYLNKNKIDFERLFESNLLPMAPPDTPIIFFVWVWEVLFPTEEFSAIPIDNCIENNNQYEPIRLKMKSKE